MSDGLNCGSGGGADTHTGLRAASVVIVLMGGLSGALFPVLARRSSWLRVPGAVFDFAKFFGSGVIIATAFIHLLSPALDELSSPCLSPAWREYPYALAFALLSIFSIFIVEIIAFRWGTGTLARLGISHDAHGHGIGGHAAHGPETPKPDGANVEEGADMQKGAADLESHHHHHKHSTVADSGPAQIIGIAILEFGVLLHSVLIGLTLAVDPDFIILFIVVIFHQTFEGLGIGSRLAFMQLPDRYRRVPIWAAVIFGFAAPLGIAVGLGVRTAYNPGSTTASIVSGVMDSVSAGILIYTGLVELLAHEFLFNPEMSNASNGKLAYAIGCMLLGCALMALLGKWA